MIERYRAIETVLAHISDDDLLLSTTGMISREVFATEDRPRNFYMLGSMGLLSSFGLGLAIRNPRRRVFVLDGDGSALMSLGTLALIGAESPANLVHIILDNEAYESTGAQPSISATVDLAGAGQSCGYAGVARVDAAEALAQSIAECDRHPGPHMVLIKVGIAPVEGIPRVSLSPTDIRDRLRNSLQP